MVTEYIFNFPVLLCGKMGKIIVPNGKNIFPNRTNLFPIWNFFFPIFPSAKL